MGRGSRLGVRVLAAEAPVALEFGVFFLFPMGGTSVPGMTVARAVFTRTVIARATAS